MIRSRPLPVRAHRSALLRTFLVVLPWVAGACAADAPSDERPSEVPLLELADVPHLEIGVLEGEPAYQLETVVGVRRLPDGAIAVSDAQAARVSMFSAEGTILHAWGGRGQGPGEFVQLARVYPWPGDSVLALDAGDGSASLFDREGNHARELTAVDLSGDSVFSMDVWLHRRFLVYGVLAPGERERVRTVLAALRPPAEGLGYRRVRLARDGRIWIHEPQAGGPAHERWTIVDPLGRPEALIDLPRGLRADDAGPDEVIGRWRGENDVHFVRAYRVVNDGATASPPTWLASPAAEQAPAGAGTTPGTTPGTTAATGQGSAAGPELAESARAALRQLATAQELHYSAHLRYADSADSLDMELDHPLGIDILEANDRGWSAIFTRPGLDHLCGIGYGAATPAGWPGGTVVCGR